MGKGLIEKEDRGFVEKHPYEIDSFPLTARKKRHCPLEERSDFEVCDELIEKIPPIPIPSEQCRKEDIISHRILLEKYCICKTDSDMSTIGS